MEEKIKEIVEQALMCKARIQDADYNYVTVASYKQLPVPGDIIEYDFKKYEVVKREFDSNYTRSWDTKDCNVTIIVKCITPKDEDEY